MKRILTPTAFLIMALPLAASAREQIVPAKKPRDHATSQPSRGQSVLVRQKTVLAANAREQSMLARVTVYWAKGGSGSDRFTRQHKTATGVPLRRGHCAVDPRRIPYGSQVIFPDGRFTAVDTGTAVINRKAARLSGHSKAECNAVVVDRFFETKRQALAWEKTHPPFMMVRVVPPQRFSPQQQRIAAEKYPRAISLHAQPSKVGYPRAALVAKK